MRRTLTFYKQPYYTIIPKRIEPMINRGFKFENEDLWKSQSISFWIFFPDSQCIDNRGLSCRKNDSPTGNQKNARFQSLPLKIFQQPKKQYRLSVNIQGRAHRVQVPIYRHLLSLD